MYWESVSSVVSLGAPRQKQNGLHGSVTGLLAGEYATDILNAEPSGIIVTFSSGRVAHVAVRDSQGKPGVTVNFLQNRHNTGGRGFFGGIKNALGGGFWRREVTAARAGQSHQRGQRDIIVATSAGLIEVWDTRWNSGSHLKEEYDIKQEICNAVNSDIAKGATREAIIILDIALSTDGHIQERDSCVSVEEPWSLFVVIAQPHHQGSENLYVVHLFMSASQTRVLSVRPVDLQHIQPSPKTTESKPKLFIPEGATTAFIVIGQSVILLSLAPPEEPLDDSSKLHLPFQDSINFRLGRDYELLGAGFENPSNAVPHPTCLVMVRAFGPIRITALPRAKAEDGTEDARITAKDKLEQAVFYGTMPKNPLNLASQGDLAFDVQEIELATLEICRGLLRSKTKFIPNAAISVDQNLRFRAKSLDDLAYFLMQHNNRLSRLVWWELLWSAEKIAAQRAVWKMEAGMRRHEDGKASFLSYVIGLMGEKFKTRSASQGGADDHVRHWFIYDTYRMEHIVPWIYNAVKPQKGSSRQRRRMSEQVLRASELCLAILETAFNYRDENAGRYGLSQDLLKNGILNTGYENLEQFWTSQGMVYTETGNLLNLQLDSCRAWAQDDGLAIDHGIVSRIAQNSANQIRVLDHMHSERIRWLTAQASPTLRDEATAIEREHARQRRWQLFKLAGIGQLREAMNLAETFCDMSVLVELIIELQDQTKCQNLSQILSRKASALGDDVAEEIRRKFSLYFERFGEQWANTFFTRQIAMGQSGTLLAMREFQPYVTRFLRNTPAYSRLSWISDVIGENDHAAAALTLEKLAVESEPDIWCHQVELSLAKINRLASHEATRATDDYLHLDDVGRLETYSELDAIQGIIYTHIQPALQGAIDRKAEVDLACDYFGRMVAVDRPSFLEMLNDAIASVVNRQVIGPDPLVSLLTLMDPGSAVDYPDSELSGQEFYFALEVIRRSFGSLMDPLYCGALKKLVWRRCLIRNDWVAIGKTAENPGGAAESVRRETALFRTLTLCSREGMCPREAPYCLLAADNKAEHTGNPKQPALIYIPQSASELLLSKSDSDILMSRFTTEKQAQFARDLDTENEKLQRHLEDGELGFWFNHLLAQATTERVAA